MLYSGSMPKNNLNFCCSLKKLVDLSETSGVGVCWKATGFCLRQLREENQAQLRHHLFDRLVPPKYALVVQQPFVYLTAIFTTALLESFDHAPFGRAFGTVPLIEKLRTMVRL